VSEKGTTDQQDLAFAVESGKAAVSIPFGVAEGTA
jgi:hypothetical protein